MADEMADLERAIQQEVEKKRNIERSESFEDLLKRAASDSPARPKTQEANRRRLEEKMDSIAAEDENLGETFELTPWLPPDIQKAKEFKKNAMFRQGDVRLDSVEIIYAPDLGAGVTLYFQFAMSMAICLFVMSFLALPELIFVYNGTSITEENQDAFGLYKYTLGNIGFDKEASDYKTISKCVGGRYAANETCIHVGTSEFSLTDATNIITAMEFLQIIVFFCGILHLYRRAFSVTGKSTKSDVSVSDYAIMIENIPADTTDKELVEHFSNLYKLNEIDFKHRPAVKDARPVPMIQKTKNSIYSGTWVAECVIHKAIGGFISSFKSKQDVMQLLYRCRAKMKMYAENSPHVDGHNLVRFRKAEAQVQKQTAIIQKVTTENIQKTGLKIIREKDIQRAKSALSPHRGTSSALDGFLDKDDDNVARPGTAAPPGEEFRAPQRLVSDKNSVYYNIDAPAVCAFVVFEYTESFARCVNDYERFAHYPWNLFYPNELKFRGEHKIHVKRAPEPDQIVWENLEIPKQKAMYLRARTSLLTAILVIVCFIIILQASIYKAIFSGKIPSRSLCQEIVPELFTNRSSSFPVDTVELIRPPAALQATLDANCSAVVKDTFYTVYAKKGDWDNQVADYSVDACVKSTDYPAGGLCPAVGEKTLCPCASISASTECSYYGCKYDKENSVCKTFPAEVIGACYCYSSLGDLISKSGVVNALDAINSLSDGECGAFFKQYSVASGLTYVSVATTTVVNVMLRKFLKTLATHEARTSSDAEQGSIMTKIFLSNFATMAIIVIVAYGSAKNLPLFFKVLHIFNGPYEDFTVEWYGNIGFYLMTTFIIQSFSPLVANILSYLFIKPVLRMYHHKQIAAMKSHSIVMQHDLNMLEVGPVFDSTDHTAQLLTLLFFAMLYAPGLPLLMPLCCFAFTLYFRVDKFLLCRFYQKPPHIGDAAMRLVISYLPYAAVLRLCFACWMFGNKHILYTQVSSSTQAYESFLEHIRNAQSGSAFANDRIFRSNVFPLFILLLVIMLGIFLNRFWKQLPVFWVWKVIQFVVMSIFYTTKDLFADQSEGGMIDPWDLLRLGDPLRRQSAPFTGEYFRFVKHKDEIPDTCVQMFEYAYLTQLNETEMEEGWRMEDRGDFVVQIKEFPEEGKRPDGQRYHKGDKKMTYEVIQDHRCNSYNVEDVPSYRLAINGLREGIAHQLYDGADPDYLPEDVELGQNVLANKKYKPEAGGAANRKIVVPVESSQSGTAFGSSAGTSAPQSTTNKAVNKAATQAAGNRNFTIDDFLEGNDAMFKDPHADDHHGADGKKKKKKKVHHQDEE